MWWPGHARVALGQAERALELGSAGQQLARGDRQRQRLGHVPARAAQQQRARRRDGAHDRVVGARADRAVVHEDVVGDARQALAAHRRRGRRSARRRRCRWSSRAARGVGQQQVVQRRVGQHHAELGAARRDRRRDAARRRAAARGRSGARGPSAAAPRPPQRDQRPRGVEVGGHERERPVLAVLARPQPRHGAPRRRRGTRGGSRPGP